MHKFLRIIWITLIFVPGVCFSAHPIENLIDVPVPVNIDGSQPSVDEVKSAIISACRKRGWSPALESDSKIKASILIRSKHYAEIEIPFSDKSYSIIYKSSRGLDYNEKKQKIHGNYNKWVVKLSASIQREFGVRSQGY
jgi:hypothetical protein